MLQRIQTIHLLIVVALLVALFFPNYATVTLGPPQPSVTQGDPRPGTTQVTAADGTVVRTTVVQNDQITFNLWGIYQNDEKIVPTTYMAVLVILALATAFVTIFLYRKRWLQVRLCFALAIMLLGIEGFIVMYIYKLTDILDTLAQYAVKYSVFDLFPVFGLFFVYFAFRGIARDEALVKSLDRIR